MLENKAIELSKTWLEKVVIGQNFCPFAAKPFFDQAIRFVVGSATEIQKQLLEECQFLDENEETETTLIIVTEGLDDFLNYLDKLSGLEDLLVENNYEGIYQIASFHPNYQFEGSSEEDPANYTNRSPYPMFHLLREAQLEKAIAAHPNPEGIPERNVEHARNLGIEFMKGLIR